MSSASSSNATGWPVSQNLGNTPNQQNVQSAEVVGNAKEAPVQPARKKRTLLPGIPFRLLQRAQVVRTAKVPDTTHTHKPVVDRDVEMSTETQPKPSATSMLLKEPNPGLTSQRVMESIFSPQTTIIEGEKRFICPYCDASLGLKSSLKMHIAGKHKDLLSEAQISSPAIQKILASFIRKENYWTKFSCSCLTVASLSTRGRPEESMSMPNIKI